jgi:hypothetical protein
MCRLHDNIVLVPADKASNNIVFVCKDYYNCEYISNELEFTSTSANSTYTRTNVTKDEILQYPIFPHSYTNQDHFQFPYL